MSDAKPGAEVVRTSPGVLFMLALMMFLQYFIQGSYMPIISLYLRDALHFSPTEIGFVAAAIAVGPILIPFLLGQIVDRYFATERVLAVCHFLAGVLMFGLYYSRSLMPIVVLGTLYSILYVPTMMLTNSLAMQHLANRDVWFPRVRVMGTIGFIVPAFIIELFLIEKDNPESRGVAFALAALAGIAMGVYSWFLPHTPPQQTEEKSYAPGVVAGMLRERPFLVLVVTSFFAAIVHKFYFVWNGPFLSDILLTADEYVPREQMISSIGQIFEIGVMAVLGLCIKRLGYRLTLLLGLGAYAARCFLFAAVFSLDLGFESRLAIACFGQALHGLCFGCFLATAFLFVDLISPRDVRGSMQTIYGTFVIALGFFIGSFVAGSVGAYFTTGTGDAATIDWPQLWLSCGILGLACVIGFALWFPRGPYEEEENEDD